MKLPPVVSPAEWQVAHDELLVKEKEATRARDELAAERRRQPMVALTLALRGDGGEVPARVREALAAVGLEERAHHRVAHLSMGERVRVAVARALAPRPALLLADEPTPRLDQANALAVAALFSRLARERGTAIVCATHDPVAIEQADEEIALGGAAGTFRLGAASVSIAAGP